MQIPLFNLQKQIATLTPSIKKEWTSILHQTAFTSGQATPDFERAFAKFIGVKNALAVRSGTASLIIALKAAGIKAGDEVITTPCTFSATADAIILVGAKPVLIDVLPENGNLNPAKIERAVSSKTRAILLVHLYGIPCEMDSILKIAKKHRLLVIEDASHAHGSLYKGKKVGALGLGGCFSLYPSKTLGALGNAGLIVSNSKQFIDRAEQYAHHGLKKGGKKYQHFLSGYNELIDNIQAAALSIKLPLLSSWIKRKRLIAEKYNKVFKEHGHLGMDWSAEVEPSLYVYAVQIKGRKRFIEYMATHGIETGIYYPKPVHLLPSMKHLDYSKGSLPMAEQFFANTVSLPLYPELTEKEVAYICQKLDTFLR